MERTMCEICNNDTFESFAYTTGEAFLIKKAIKFNIRNLWVNPVKCIVKHIPITPKNKTLRSIKDLSKFYNDFRSLKKIRRGLTLFKDKKIYVCKKCELGFVYPRISEERLIQYYNHEYWKTEEGGLEDIKGFRSQGQMDFIRSYIDIQKLKKTIEFGSASARLSRYMKSLQPGMQADCIEPGENWHILLKDHVNKLYYNIDEVHESYDLLMSSHSLEHVSDLTRYFKRFKEIVKKEGYLFFEVPNSVDPDEAFIDYQTPHTYFFTEKTMRDIARRFKLEIIAMKTFGRSSEQRNHRTRKDIKQVDENPNGIYLRVLFKV